jgi:hypothetical protein
VIDLSDFLKTAVTLAGFQNDGKHIFLRDKLNSLQSGRQIVYSLAITIRWLISSGPDAFCGSRQEIIKYQLCPVQVWSILLLKIQMLIIFIRLLMKNTARTNHYLSGQRIWWITSGIEQIYVIHRRNILLVKCNWIMSLEKKSNYLDSCCNTSLVWKIEKKHKSNKQNGSQNK